MIKKPLTLLCFLFNFSLFAQNIKDDKFGAIKLEDFSPKSSVITGDEAAIVLLDVGSSEFVGNNNGSFSILFKQHKKILIKRKAAFDAASFKVKLYQGNYETIETLEKLEAATYNIEGGKIVPTKLAKENVIKEKYNRLYNINKFTMPNVKEGCIIEYSYTVKSQFDRHLHSWDFQNEYPTLWSEFQVTIPPMYNYVSVKKGNFKDYMAIDSVKSVFKVYSILAPGNGAFSSSSIYSFSGDAKCIMWAMKDVPAYKHEDFVANATDNIASIEFQLHSIKYSENETWVRIKSWMVTVDDLYKNERFGLVLNKEELPWLNKETETITKQLEGLDAAKKIYNHIQSGFTCNDFDAILMSDNPKKIYDIKKGNVADINLLLTAMLARKGFVAEPIFISTRGNGKINETSALLEQFNYVVCRLKIDSTFYFLDAADSKTGFGNLSPKCYNGYGRIIANPPYLINFSANNFHETKNTVAFVGNATNNKIEGSINVQLGNYESQVLREKLLNTNPSDFFKDLAKSYTYEVKIENQELENQKKPEEPVNIKYDINFALPDEDIVYFNPFLTGTKKDNLFKADKRIAAVELPHTIDESYTLDMEIPTGYIVDELPKSVRSKYNENEGMFEYIISNKDGHIQLRSRFKLEKANFEIEDYESLRDFYGLMVKKQAEQIVFKKIKK